MCDFSTVAGLFTGASVAITAACVLIATAVVLNAGIFTSGGSPALMLAAAASCAVACGLVAGAYAAAEDFFNCAASTYPGVSRCTLIGSFKTDLQSLSFTLGGLTVACAATAAGAWIPGLGAIGMIAVSAGLVTLLGFIAKMIQDFNNVAACVNAAAGSPLIPGWFIYVLAVLVGVVALTTAWVWFKALPAWWKMIFPSPTH